MGWQQQQQQQERNRRWTRRTGQKTGRKTTKNKNDADVDADVDDRSIVSSNRVPVRPSFEIFFFAFSKKVRRQREQRLSLKKNSKLVGSFFCISFFLCVSHFAAPFIFRCSQGNGRTLFFGSWLKNPVKPSKTQYNLVQPSKTQQNPVQPSTTQ